MILHQISTANVVRTLYYEGAEITQERLTFSPAREHIAEVDDPVGGVVLRDVGRLALPEAHLGRQAGRRSHWWRRRGLILQSRRFRFWRIFS